MNTDMDKIKEGLMEVLNAFTQQEMGNKISQFNMTGLSTVIGMKLNELAEDKEVVEGD